MWILSMRDIVIDMKYVYVIFLWHDVHFSIVVDEVIDF